MCTVVVEVPEQSGAAVRLLAVRDEDPERAWDAPGAWWPEQHPGVIGVRDRRANGAWLAASAADQRLSVLLNRVESPDAVHPAEGLESRGSLVLHSVAGAALDSRPRTAGFNLVAVQDGMVAVTSWDGVTLHHETLAPGTHMLAHHDVDDAARTPRIAAWLPEFEKLQGVAGDWRTAWAELLNRTTEVSVEDDRAILRDNRVHGYPTQSLLVCLAEVGTDSLRLDTAVLDEPAAAGQAISLQFRASV